MKTQWIRALLVCISILGLAACATTEDEKAGTEGQTTTETPDTKGIGEGGDIQVDPFTDPTNPLSKSTVYFDFDSADISPEDRTIILAHAEYLAANPDTRIVLEGHADERGTREYNIALGEKRAKAVEQLMLLQGVSKSQLDVISFGEERPVALGHDESSWRLNRRVEILYPGK
jgi:peptidoglycan-associated lipoprotein